MKRLELVRFSGIETKTNGKVSQGQIFTVEDNYEADKLLDTGYFIEHEIEDTFELSDCFEEVSKNYSASLPDNLERKKILVINSGGIGDCLIGMSVVTYLQNKGAYVSYGVPEEMREFFRPFDITLDYSSSFNNESYLNSFDNVIRLSDFLKNNEKYVVPIDYYQRAYNIVGIKDEIKLPTFNQGRPSHRVEKFLSTLKNKKLVGCHL